MTWATGSISKIGLTSLTKLFHQVWPGIEHKSFRIIVQNCLKSDYPITHTKQNYPRETRANYKDS